MNPYIKNCRTGYQEDSIQRAAHYAHLLESKSTIDNKHRKRYYSLTRSSHRQTLDSERFDNLRLFRSIQAIERKKSRYAVDNEETSLKGSLKNPYRERQKERQIAEDNVRLLKKINSVNSEVSQGKISEFGEKVGKYSKLITRPFRNILAKDREQYQQYEQKRYRARGDLLVGGFSPKMTSGAAHRQKKMKKKLQGMLEQASKR